MCLYVYTFKYGKGREEEGVTTHTTFTQYRGTSLIQISNILSAKTSELLHFTYITVYQNCLACLV